MRIRLSESTSTASSPYLDSVLPHPSPNSTVQEKPPFLSRTTEWRATKKAKDNLPNTPAKKAVVIEKLAQSPICAQILKENGVLIAPEALIKIDMGDFLINSLASTKKAVVIEKLPQSPICAQILKENGVLIAPEALIKIDMGDFLINSLASNIKDHKTRPEETSYKQFEDIEENLKEKQGLV